VSVHHRTNTVILIDREGNVSFTERTMLNCDITQWSTNSFHFKLQEWGPDARPREEGPHAVPLSSQYLLKPCSTTVSIDMNSKAFLLKQESG